MNPYKESNGNASERTKARKAERQRIISIIKPEITVVDRKLKLKPYVKTK